MYEIIPQIFLGGVIMTLFASPSLVFLAIISFTLSYLIGVKQYTWLLSGFNQQRVKDKVKLSKMIGLYNLAAGVVATIGSVFTTPDTQIIIPIVIIGTSSSLLM